MTERLSAEQMAVRAYCAGILDGEGYIGAARRAPRGTSVSPRFTVRVSLMMADREPVDLVAKLVGVKIYIRNRGNARHSPMYCMDATAFQAVQLLTMVMPFLRCKHNQAQLACKLHDLKQSPLRFKTVVGGKNSTRILSDTHIAQCDKLYLQMRRRTVTNNGIEARPL